MKIVLPVDGSENALRAVRHLVEHVSWFAELPEIHLLHVHPPIPLGRVQAHIGHEALHAYYREESEQQLRSAVQQLDAAGLAYTMHIHVGQPAEVIARLAGDLDCALILMGSKGLGAFAGALMGSVATQVLHLTHCPVMIVK